ATILQRRKPQHFEHDLVLGPRALGAWIADENAMTEDGAIDAHISLAVALKIGADEFPRGPFQHLQHDASRVVSRTLGFARDPHQHFIAFRRIQRIVLADHPLRSRLAVDDVRTHVAGSGPSTPIDARNGPVWSGSTHCMTAAHLNATLL